jgi:hypothetical protein
LGSEALGSYYCTIGKTGFFNGKPYYQMLTPDCTSTEFYTGYVWWDYISKHDFLATTRVKTYRNTWVDGNAYRAAFRANNLINAYSAFTYFKKAELSQEIFYWIKQFMSDWDSWSRYLIPVDRQQFPSIDLGLAMAVKLLDCEQQVTSTLNYPTFTHMKSGCQGWARSRENWEDVLGVYNDGIQIKIGPYVQSGILHYVKKDFVTDSIRNMFL